MNEIETMAKVMAGCEKTCDECFAEYEKLFTQPIQNRGKHCQAIEYCTKLHNAGYKNCKDKVVLSKEELNTLIGNIEKSSEIKAEELEKVRKETARDFYHEIMSYIGANQKFWIVDDEHITIINVDELFDFVIELAKQYGVEVE